MRTWLIEGAYRASGEDISTSVETETKREAMQWAHDNDIMVSSIIAADEVLPAGEADMPAKPPAPAMTRKPIGPMPVYREIKRDGATIAAFGLAVLIIGSVWLSVAVVLALIGIANAVTTRDWMFLFEFLSEAIRAIIVIVFGAAIRLFGHIALAVRDIARNSFR